MKKILISVNVCLLVLALLLLIVNLARSEKTAAIPAKNHAKSSTKKSVAAKKSADSAKTEPAPLPATAESVDKITGIDIFSSFRSPLATVRSGRAEMALVGVFMVGEVRGAIIKQTGGNRQVNPYIAQMMAMAGGPGPGPGNIGQRNNNNQRGGNRRSSSRTGNAGNFAGGPPPGGMPGGFRPPWMSGNSNSNQTVKQYVRIGETMSNGYTLTAVTRTRATLIRGNDKVELELLDPSKNRVSSSNSTPKLNNFQQFQQAQMFMQSQMLRTMQRMERNAGGGPNPNNGGRGRGR